MEQIALTAQRKDEAGFTLVELAVVLIIIGLLVGGVLKGQELIESARMKSTLSQIDDIRLAVQAFQDKYGAYPGDITNPNNVLPDCTATPCSTAGNGNSRIDNGTSTLGSTPAGEVAVAFTHLSKADLIKSMSATDTFLDAKIGGVFWVGYSAGTARSASGTIPVRSGHYIVLSGDSASNAAETGKGLTGSHAAQIDRALDDGNPATGTVYGVGGTNCLSGGTYVENSSAPDCSLYIAL